MGRKQIKENAIKDPAVLTPGRHADGAGLYLYITKDGKRRVWQFRATPYAGAAPKNFEIGEFPAMSTNKARAAVEDIKEAVKDGEELLTVLGLQRPVGAPLVTLEDFARARHANLSKELTEQHRADWIAGLERHVFPALGERPISAIRGEELAAAIRPIWECKNPTAQRLLTQLRGVWKMAIRHQHSEMVEGNVADGVELLLADIKHKVRHFVAMPHAEVPAFYAAVRGLGNVATALTLRFLILTGARSNEARGARWNEIDMNAEGGPIWTIPEERMKSKREHKVALCPETVEILKAAEDLAGDSSFVFPSPRTGKELSIPALLKVINKAAEDVGEEFACTVHGFRSSFRQWAAEAGENDVQAELFLAHSVKVSAVEDDYRRGARDMRAAREITQRWAAFVVG